MAKPFDNRLKRESSPLVLSFEKSVIDGHNDRKFTRRAFLKKSARTAAWVLFAGMCAAPYGPSIRDAVEYAVADKAAPAPEEVEISNLSTVIEQTGAIIGPDDKGIEHRRGTACISQDLIYTAGHLKLAQNDILCLDNKEDYNKTSIDDILAIKGSGIAGEVIDICIAKASKQAKPGSQLNKIPIGRGIPEAGSWLVVVFGNQEACIKQIYPAELPSKFIDGQVPAYIHDRTYFLAQVKCIDNGRIQAEPEKGFNAAVADTRVQYHGLSGSPALSLNKNSGLYEIVGVLVGATIWNFERTLHFYMVRNLEKVAPDLWNRVLNS